MRMARRNRRTLVALVGGLISGSAWYLSLRGRFPSRFKIRNHLCNVIVGLLNDLRYFQRIKTGRLKTLSIMKFPIMQMCERQCLQLSISCSLNVRGVSVI